jgi:hypothetical protein
VKCTASVDWAEIRTGRGRPHMAAKPKTPIMVYAEEVKMISIMRRILSKSFPILVNR